jgi:phospholipase C
LPNFSFVEPDWSGPEQNDMHPHPNSDLGAGDRLLARLYESLRTGPHWPHAALLVLFDEHGGTYDHVPPPATIPPDDKRSDDPRVDFTRLGVRVPAMLISPYSPAGTVTTLFDHTSVIATLRDLFGLDIPAGLGRRARAANSLVGTLQAQPRTDIPRLGTRPSQTPRSVSDPALPLDANQRLNLNLLALLSEIQAGPSPLRGLGVARGSSPPSEEMITRLVQRAGVRSRGVRTSAELEAFVSRNRR